MSSLATARRHAATGAAATPGAERSQAFAGNAPGEALRRFIADATFPCVGAKAALAHDAIDIHGFGPLGDRRNDARLLDRLDAFAGRLDAADADAGTLYSFAAIFDGPRDTDEQRFEALLWSQLQRLHELDVRRGRRWAGDVSRDPDDPRFSLSLAGHPYFVIGLHPGASRTARRFACPALVFNPHRQFERLRADGRYRKMQAAIRGRDVDLQGSINPNLADFGDASEARQYSGRAVGPEWKCPLRVRGAK